MSVGTSLGVLERAKTGRQASTAPIFFFCFMLPSEHKPRDRGGQVLNPPTTIGLTPSCTEFLRTRYILTLADYDLADGMPR